MNNELENKLKEAEELYAKLKNRTDEAKKKSSAQWIVIKDIKISISQKKIKALRDFSKTEVDELLNKLQENKMFLPSIDVDVVECSLEIAKSKKVVRKRDIVTVDELKNYFNERGGFDYDLRRYHDTSEITIGIFYALSNGFKEEEICKELKISKGQFKSSSIKWFMFTAINNMIRRRES